MGLTQGTGLTWQERGSVTHRGRTGKGKAAGVCAVGEDGKRPVPWCLPVPGPRPGLDVPLQLVSPSEKEERKEEILYWGGIQERMHRNLHPPNVSGVSRAGGERDF